MRISHFFIDRPIFASVVSIVFVILGAVAFFRLPIAQYPEIAPPTINVTGQYPGASADVVASTVVAPIEEQINGVENMLYVSSNSTADGRFAVAVTFDLGTNLDIAQVQVQNRVAIAQPRLPAGVLNQPPVDTPGAFQIAVKTLGRLADPEEFANIVVKQTASAVVRLRDVAKVELAALDYTTNSYLDLDPAVALAIFQRPGSNALATANTIRDTMEQLAPRFPMGVKYNIVYDPTRFIQESVVAVQETIIEAIVLVVLVVIL